MPTTNDAELPSYAKVQAQPSPVSGSEHHIYLEEGKDQKWLSLFVRSRSRDAASIPMFFEDDEISGRVEINLDKVESAKSVTISLRAGTTFVGQDEMFFLKEMQTLWTPTAGNGSKLKGKYSWPFSFVLKHEIQIKDDKKNETAYHIPPNFSERASPAYIDYKLVVTVHRKMLRVNQVLSMNLGYLPITFPDPPSALRRLAYAEGNQLIGPDGDPEGWKVLAPIQVKGTLFSVKQAEVECTLAIALPLSYAIGSAIPFVIVLTGRDTQVLDILGNPSAIRLRLVRSLATGSEATDDKDIRRTDKNFLEHTGQAYFWVSKGAEEVNNKRVLQGELELVKTLKPSFKFPNITIRYILELLPFEAAGFMSEQKDSALLSEEVTLTTRQIPGLITRSYAPPGYKKPQIVDYNTSVGLLETGNQRFVQYHHHFA